MKTATMIAAALIGGASASSNGGWDGSAIYWTATGMSERYVLDVNGFANEVPKKMMLWRRDGSTPNGNEYFKYVNGAIMWQTEGTSTWLCLEAGDEPGEPGARVQMNYCNGGAKQTWQLKGTATAQIDSFKIELKSFPGRCVGIADNKGANYQTVQLRNCDDDSQISFVAAGWKADPDTPPAPAPPVPPPAPTGTPCDRAQSDPRYPPCYSKFQCGAGDFKCRCVNGPGTDPSKFTWYQWMCGQGLSVAFMDSSCHQCNGLMKNGKVQPCPCHYTDGNVQSNVTFPIPIKVDKCGICKGIASKLVAAGGSKCSSVCASAAGPLGMIVCGPLCDEVKKGASASNVCKAAHLCSHVEEEAVIV